MFYEQLQKACALRNLKLTPLLKEMGISTGNTGSWKKGGSPSIEVLNSLSLRLDVSTDYLLGKTDDPTPADKRERPHWLIDISDLSEKDKKEILAIIEMKRANK